MYKCLLTVTSNMALLESERTSKDVFALDGPKIVDDVALAVPRF